MSTGEQLEVLDGFRRGVFNVLVATNVIEEGLDIRSCNVVIKADAVTNYRSFIQSQVFFFCHFLYLFINPNVVSCFWVVAKWQYSFVTL